MINSIQKFISRNKLPLLLILLSTMSQLIIFKFKEDKALAIIRETIKAQDYNGIQK